MIPTMYKIAGELTPTCWHVTARSIAAQALSIFGDHQDVMAVRQTGFALLASNSVQEAHDLALIGTAATLKSQVPFIHLRRIPHLPSAEVPLLSDSTADDDRRGTRIGRARRADPTGPIRGTSQKPRVFPGQEAVNSSTGRRRSYRSTWTASPADGPGLSPVRLRGLSEADVVVLWVRGRGRSRDVDCLTARGEKVGVLKVRCTGPSASRTSRRLFPRPPGLSRCSIAPRSRGRQASLSTST